MDAHPHLARRDRGSRPMIVTAARSLAPAAADSIPRLGRGPWRDRTPSPVPSGPRADALVPRRAPGRRVDPRWYQIGMLSVLLAYGMFGIGFDLDWGRIVVLLAATLGTQLLCTRLWRLPAFDPLSALITGLGLCTLLRTGAVTPLILAAVVAIAGKFLLRWRGKHLFNPTNLALIVMLWAGAGWISPGQYGHVAFVALLIVCLGLTVVCKAARSDVTLAFLAVYAALLFGRSLWLGEPMSIPIHRLQSGLLLQFAFNMISDPRTTPDSRAGRVLFGALVAIGAGIVQFVLFRTNGPVWSLAACALCVPLIDRLLPGPRHQWKPRTAMDGATSRGIAVPATIGPSPEGVTHESPVPAFAPPPARASRRHGGGMPAAVRLALARLRP